MVYAVEDLQAWADRGAKVSTTDPGAGTVHPAKRQTGGASIASRQAAEPVAAAHP